MKMRRLISAIIALVQYISSSTFIAQLMSISWGALAGAFLAPFLFGLDWKRASKAACWVSFWRFETMIHEGLIPPPVALRYGAMLAALQAEVGRDAWLEPEPGSGREDNA